MAVLALIAIVINFTALTHHDPAKLVGPDVATRLSQAIQAQEGTSTPPQVECPGTEPVRNGYTFTCTLIRGGHRQVIRVHETSDQGRFTWSLPPGPAS